MLPPWQAKCDGSCERVACEERERIERDILPPDGNFTTDNSPGAGATLDGADGTVNQNDDNIGRPDTIAGDHVRHGGGIFLMQGSQLDGDDSRQGSRRRRHSPNCFDPGRLPSPVTSTMNMFVKVQQLNKELGYFHPQVVGRPS